MRYGGLLFFVYMSFGSAALAQSGASKPNVEFKNSPEIAALRATVMLL